MSRLAEPPTTVAAQRRRAHRCGQRRSADHRSRLTSALLTLLALTVGLGVAAWGVALGCAAVLVSVVTLALARAGAARDGARRPGHPGPGAAGLRGRRPHRRAAARAPGDAGAARAHRPGPRAGCRRRPGGPAHRHGHRVRGRGSTARSTRSSSSCSAWPPPRRSAGGCWPPVWRATPSPPRAGCCRGCGPAGVPLLAQGRDRASGIVLTVGRRRRAARTRLTRPGGGRPGPARRVVRPRRVVALAPPCARRPSGTGDAALAAGRRGRRHRARRGAGVVRAGGPDPARPAHPRRLPAPPGGGASSSPASRWSVVAPARRAP